MKYNFYLLSYVIDVNTYVYIYEYKYCLSILRCYLHKVIELLLIVLCCIYNICL